MLLDLVILGLLLFTVFLVVTALGHIFVRVPFVPTPHGVVRKMIDVADLSGRETVYDLGAGDARFLLSAHRAHPDIRAIGYERIPTVWLLGRLRILFSRRRIDLRCKDLFSVDLSDADCIFLYLSPGLMKSLATKFDSELRPGTKVVSYVFQFHDREPVTEVVAPWLMSKRKVRMYVW